MLGLRKMNPTQAFAMQPEGTQELYRKLWLQDYAPPNYKPCSEEIQAEAAELWDHSHQHIAYAMRRAERESADKGLDERQITRNVQAVIACHDPENSFYQEMRALRSKRVDAETRRTIFGDYITLPGRYIEPGTAGRPSWDDYFLGLAFVASRRSHDAQTKHGCVIVDRQNLIIGMGYNGHISGAPDGLPVTRPSPDKLGDPETDKYMYMVHSEPNALASCTVPPRFVPGGVRAYITGRPCLYCSQLLWQNHVREWILAERKGWTNPRPEEEEAFRKLGLDQKIQIKWIRPDLDWLFDTDYIRELQELGFVRE